MLQASQRSFSGQRAGWPTNEDIHRRVKRRLAEAVRQKEIPNQSRRNDKKKEQVEFPMFRGHMTLVCVKEESRMKTLGWVVLPGALTAFLYSVDRMAQNASLSAGPDLSA